MPRTVRGLDHVRSRTRGRSTTCYLWIDVSWLNQMTRDLDDTYRYSRRLGYTVGYYACIVLRSVISSRIPLSSDSTFSE